MKLFFCLKKKKGKVNLDLEKVIKNGFVCKLIYFDYIVIYLDVMWNEGILFVFLWWIDLNFIGLIGLYVKVYCEI